MRTGNPLIVAITATVACLTGSPVFATDLIQAVGTIGYCGAPGGIKLKPSLVDGGAAPAAGKVKYFNVGAGCTSPQTGSGDGLRLAGIRPFKGTISLATNDCQSIFVNDGLPPFDLTVKWFLNGRPRRLFLPTTINFAATPPSSINTAGPNGSVVITMTGTGAASGSFAGNHFTLEVTTDQTWAQIQEECASPKGLRWLTWAPLNRHSNAGSLEDGD
jgi:hypothetical protein